MLGLGNFRLAVTNLQFPIEVCFSSKLFQQLLNSFPSSCDHELLRRTFKRYVDCVVIN